MKREQGEEVVFWIEGREIAGRILGHTPDGYRVQAYNGNTYQIQSAELEVRAACREVEPGTLLGYPVLTVPIENFGRTTNGIPIMPIPTDGADDYRKAADEMRKNRDELFAMAPHFMHPDAVFQMACEPPVERQPVKSQRHPLLEWYEPGGRDEALKRLAEREAYADEFLALPTAAETAELTALLNKPIPDLTESEAKRLLETPIEKFRDVPLELVLGHIAAAEQDGAALCKAAGFATCESDWGESMVADMERNLAESLWGGLRNHVTTTNGIDSAWAEPGKIKEALEAGAAAMDAIAAETEATAEQFKRASNRVKLLRCNLDLLVMMLNGLADHQYVALPTCKPLPAGTKVLDMFYDAFSNSLIARCWNASWEEVPDGAQAPYIHDYFLAPSEVWRRKITDTHE